LRLVREGDALYVAGLSAELPFDRWPQMPGRQDSLAVSIPGRLDLAGGWTFSSDQLQAIDRTQDPSANNRDPFQVWLDAEGLPDSLQLRIRHTGDQFKPLGLGGHSQKLSDFFINSKVPQRARGRWPVLCAGGEVIWIPGHRPADRYKIKPASTHLVHFTVNPPPEI
jgi:tRNA(Ile)-lysidine synthase